MTEQNSDSSGDADAGAEGNTPTPSGTVARAELDKAIERRTAAIEKSRGLEAENAKMAAELEKLKTAEASKPTTGVAPAPADMPEWGKALVAKIDGLGSQFDSYKTSSATGDATKAILAQVPDGAKETVKVMLPGLGVDLTSPTAVADAMAALTTHHPSVMVDHSRGTPRRAPQAGPDGKLSFDGFATIDDIPPEHRGAAFADPATLQRLVTEASGATTRGGDGFNI